jgi:hypothetical protein
MARPANRSCPAAARSRVHGPPLRDGGVVVAAESGDGWAYEVIEYYSLVPLRSRAVRADDLIQKLLAREQVSRAGVFRVANAIGLGRADAEAALKRVGATAIFRHNTWWYELRHGATDARPTRKRA